MYFTLIAVKSVFTNYGYNVLHSLLQEDFQVTTWSVPLPNMV